MHKLFEIFKKKLKLDFTSDHFLIAGELGDGIYGTFVASSNKKFHIIYKQNGNDSKNSVLMILKDQYLIHRIVTKKIHSVGIANDGSYSFSQSAGNYRSKISVFSSSHKLLFEKEYDVNFRKINFDNNGSLKCSTHNSRLDDSLSNVIIKIDLITFDEKITLIEA